jgi:hypothetical protein
VSMSYEIFPVEILPLLVRVCLMFDYNNSNEPLPLVSIIAAILCFSTKYVTSNHGNRIFLYQKLMVRIGIKYRTRPDVVTEVTECSR